MKRIVFLLFLACSLFAFAGLKLYAEELPAPSTSTESTAASPAPEAPAVAAPSTEPAPAEPAVSTTATSMTSTAAAPAVPAAAPSPTTETAPTAPTPAAAPENKIADNLEFVSGEITGMDQTAKTITVKLYGETENAASDKILTIKLDETADITDGEKDRDIKSLTNGTEVDVEYDPTTNKATYIFVY